MSKRRKRGRDYGKAVIDDLEAYRAEIERKKLLIALDATIELAREGAPVEYALKCFGLNPGELERRAATDEDFRKRLADLEAARMAGLKASAMVFRTFFRAMEKRGGWRVAAWLWENVYKDNPIIPPPSERKLRTDNLKITFDDE